MLTIQRYSVTPLHIKILGFFICSIAKPEFAQLLALLEPHDSWRSMNLSIMQASIKTPLILRMLSMLWFYTYLLNSIYCIQPRVCFYVHDFDCCFSFLAIKLTGSKHYSDIVHGLTTYVNTIHNNFLNRNHC